MKARLWILVLLLVVPAFALISLGNIRRQISEKAHGQGRAIATVRLTAASLSHYLRQARQQLATVTQFPLVLQQDRALTERGLRSLKRLLPDFSEFGLIETNGAVFAHVLESNVAHVVSQSLVQQVLRSREFAMALFHRYPNSNAPSLQFAYPVLDRAGVPVRAMYVSFRPTLLADVLTNVFLPPDGLVAVLDREGNVLARRPAAENFTGQAVPIPAEFRNALAANEGLFTATGGDGIRRVFAFSAALDEKKPFLTVMVGVPQQEVFAQADREFIFDSILLLFFVALLLALAWWYSDRIFVRPATAIVAAAERIAGGDLKARVRLPEGKTELHRLGKSFDQMAESLELRQRDLERANAQIKSHNADLEKRVAERTSELRAVNSELEAFSYSVSHDLRAPLRHMHGFANMVSEDPKLHEDPEVQRQLRIIIDSAERMGKLIDDLLAFSRMGRQPLTRGVVDFQALVREVVAETTAREPGRKIEWQIDPLPPVSGDASLLRQVWRNLISNAVKYSAQKSPALISIRAREADGELQFSVQDNGAGFNMAYAHKLFGVFQRLHRDEDFEGTGVGLANVRRIITRHGGRTWAEGKEGHGATFSFSLPRF
jgi:signal transduction histidine kinase